MIGKVTALGHKLRNHTMKGAALVAKTRLARAQLAKVLGRFWHFIGKKFKDNAPGVDAANGDVEVASGRHSFCFWKNKDSELISDY